MEGAVQLGGAGRGRPGPRPRPSAGTGSSSRREEVEPLTRVLVAGIGNVFLGDDGFGVELAARLAA